MVFLIFGQFVHSISGSTGLFMNMTGNHKIFRNFLFIAALINIVLNYFLSPIYGIYGAAFSAMITIMSWNIATLVYIKIKFGKSIGYFPILM
jgi:O-antigen/teichoic acid export membrane protein